ncbi:MAG: SH3 domain-containing protein [Pirellulales bacterium]|nr:SH3 domain-containing protein [Pirellulales bacterium]
MRHKLTFFFALSISSIGLLQSPISAEESFPYKAFIVADEVYVRSGPGHNYYSTDKLSKGQEVEVYRHDPGGWCAIKPPEGSFSWISSRFAKIEEGNLAVVTENNVSARVGSKLSDVRDGIQVRLRKGEVIEVLETKKIGSGDSPTQTWHKIAPPAGEFRWVSLKNLESEYVREGLLRRADDGKVRESEADAETPGGKEKHSLAEKLPHEIFQTELDRLELELSRMVAEDSNVWSFDSLRIGAESLLEGANTAVESGKARLLLSRIARFEDIKDRADKVDQLRAETERSNQYIAGLRSTMRRAKEYVDGGDDRFDGVGRLEQVAPTTPGVPRFALLDDAGNVRSYVTPSTGVNLHKYVGQQIGVVGRRGYMPEQKAQHVTANRVTVLEGQALR